ncbi:MAG: CHAT domain-containing protein [Planktothrix sp. GU0601_MAG3]|nr:MAG: CHAT domain-containing protein [Planktothrix sp. GU0601_MAG3]
MQPTPSLLTEPDVNKQDIVRNKTEQVLTIDPSIALTIENQLSGDTGKLTVKINENNQITIESSPISNSSIAEASIQDVRMQINQSFDAGDVETAVVKFEELVNLEYINYLGKPASTNQMTVTEIQSQLKRIQGETGKKTAVIYVYSRPEKLELVVVLENTVIHKNVSEAIPEVLFSQTNEFVSEITSPRKRNTTSYLQSAQQLHQWMIAPIEETLKENNIDILMLSLDTGLKSLPLAALHDGKQFLIEKYGLSMIPSFSSLDTRYRSISQEKILAGGASVFKEQGALPSVPAEIKTITEQRTEGEYLLNEQFTLENLKQQYQAQPFPIIHLATHADFRPGSPHNSFIQLWDTKLTLNQMSEMGWKQPTADLLTLSACRNCHRG